MFKDKILRCKQCGHSFVFPAAEQEFYAQKGYHTSPRRCKQCRHSGSRPTYPAVCAACGRKALVPFQPNDNQLVFCRDCWEQLRSEREEYLAAQAVESIHPQEILDPNRSKEKEISGK